MGMENKIIEKLKSECSDGWFRIKEVVDKETGRKTIVSSKVEDFNKYAGYTNWATWYATTRLDEFEIENLIKEKELNSPEELEILFDSRIKDFSDFWLEDRFNNKCLDEREYNNINWVEIFLEIYEYYNEDIQE